MHYTDFGSQSRHVLDNVLLLKHLGSFLFISVTNFITHILTFKTCTVREIFLYLFIAKNKKKSVFCQVGRKIRKNPVHYKWLGLPFDGAVELCCLPFSITALDIQCHHASRCQRYNSFFLYSFDWIMSLMKKISSAFSSFETLFSSSFFKISI